MSMLGDEEGNYEYEEPEEVPQCSHFFGECVMSKTYDCNNCWRMIEANRNIMEEIEDEKYRQRMEVDREHESG